jgi:hypothetical protein
MLAFMNRFSRAETRVWDFLIVFIEEKESFIRTGVVIPTLPAVLVPLTTITNTHIALYADNL